MARIIFDNGKEVKLSVETTERLRKELVKQHNIPEGIYVGQIFEINKSKYMVAVLGSHAGITHPRGLTCVEYNAGCWSSSTLDGVIEDFKLRELLIKKDAKYLGCFRDVFEVK